MTFGSSYQGVRTRHPEYLKRCSQWEIMRDCYEGSDAIKGKGTKYLPMTQRGERPDAYDRHIYEAFKMRADYTNYVAQIHDVLHGMIENRPAKVDVPNKLLEKGFIKNIDLQGNSLDQFISDCVSDCLITGWGGILADIPKVDKKISMSMAENLGIRPYLTYYKAESVINWKYKRVGGIKKLSMVILEEDVEDDDIFAHNLSKQWRVLRLDNLGRAIQEIYKPAEKENGDAKGDVKVSSSVILVNGEPIDYIPFITLPFAEPVKPILYDIALLNIGHYQKTADLNSANHKTTLPMAWFTGHTPEVDKNTGEPVPVTFGQDIVVQLPEPDAKVGILEFSGNGIEHNEASLTRVESQMFVLCSHIISQDKKTAENQNAISIHRQGEDAKIATYARYISKRFTDAMRIICQWEQLDDSDVNIELNTDYSSMAFDANAVNSIANIFSQGKLPLRSLYYMLQQGGYLEPDMNYEAFVYLLDLEASSLSPTEVDEAYLKYKKTGKKLELPKRDWYSPESLYSSVSETKDKEVVNIKEKEEVTTE